MPAAFSRCILSLVEVFFLFFKCSFCFDNGHLKSIFEYFSEMHGSGDLKNAFGTGWMELVGKLHTDRLQVKTQCNCLARFLDLGAVAERGR